MTAPRDLNSDRVSVLTFNIRFGLADDGPNAWRFRKDAFQPLFDRHAADFMAFQEVNHFQADDLAGILADYGRVGQRVPSPSFWQNNIIFYRRPWRCRAVNHFFLSPTPDIPSRFRESRWPRQCTMALFEKEDREVICINTHFDFNEAVQTASAEIILKRLSRHSAAIPAILMGDFNASPDAPCRRVFVSDAGESGEGEGTGATFRSAFVPPYPATHHGFSGATIGEHIDWILYRGALRLERAMVIHDRFNGRYPSDHFPVRAEFCWD